jgi:hypothetical protein
MPGPVVDGDAVGDVEETGEVFEASESGTGT